MRATDTFIVESRAVFIALTDAEPRQIPYTIRDQYRPDSLRLTFRRENIETWKLMSVELSGSSILANGAAGTDQRIERFILDVDDIPDEITALIDVYRPKEQ